jgi:hypothetical protein
LLAALVALGLGLYIYVVDRHKVSDQELGQRALHLFPVWRREDLTKIELRGEDHALVLTREPGAKGDLDFLMVEPVAGQVDPVALDRLLSGLEHGNPVRRLPEEPADFGAVVVRGVLSMGSVTHRFELGGPAPTPEGARYFRLGGEVMVVAKDIALDLMRPDETYRERTVIPYLSVALESVELARGEGRLRLLRMDETSFRIESLGARASRKAIDRVWLAFADARAESFLNEADAVKLTEPAAVRVTLFPRDRARLPAELRFGAACPGHPDDIVVLRTSPSRLAACVPKGVLDGLSVPDVDLLDTGLFAAHEDELQDVTFTPQATLKDARRFDLARSGTTFRLRAPEDRTLSAQEANAVQKWLSRVWQLHGQVRPLPRSARRWGTWSMHRADGTEEGLELSLDGVTVYVTRLSDTATLVLPALAYPLLSPSLTLLRPLQVFESAQEISRLELQCGEPARLRKTDGVFRFEAPHAAAPSGVPDQRAALDLADLLNRTQAETWLGTDAPVTPGCSVTFERAGKTHTLRLGSAGLEDAVLGQVDQGPIGIFPRALREALSRSYLDLGLVPSGYVLIGLERWVTNQWVAIPLSPEGDAGVPDASSVAADASPPSLIEPVVVRDLIEGFRADRLVHVGAPRPEEGPMTPALRVTLALRAPSAVGAAPSPASLPIRLTRVVSTGKAAEGDARFTRFSHIDAMLSARELPRELAR